MADEYPLRGIRVLVAKPGLDGHDAGAKVVALALRDAGAEVIYTGLRKTPAQITKIAIDEDVDLVGLSILSGSHVELTRAVVDALAEGGSADVPVVVGGTIPPDDVAAVREAGARAVFTVVDHLEQVVAGVAEVVRGVRS